MSFVLGTRGGHFWLGKKGDEPQLTCTIGSRTVFATREEADAALARLIDRVTGGLHVVAVEEPVVRAARGRG